jgi:hypothetical protein
MFNVLLDFLGGFCLDWPALRMQAAMRMQGPACYGSPGGTGTSLPYFGSN